MQNSSGVIPETVSVRVTNTGPRRFVGDYANQRYVCEPGQSIIAPYFAAVYWFGDPRSRNIGSKRATQYRDREIERLSVLYGVYDDPFFDEFDDGDLMTAPVVVSPDRTLPARSYVNGRHPDLPSVEVTDLATNEPIITVIDDPAGTRMAPVSQEGVETRALQDQVAALASQLQNLQAELVQRDPNAAAAAIPAQGPSTPSLSAEEITASLADSDSDSDSDSLSGEDGSVGDPTPDPNDPDAHPTADSGGRPTPRTPRAPRKK